MIWLRHFQFLLACLPPLEIVHVIAILDLCLTRASRPGLLSFSVLPVQFQSLPSFSMDLSCSFKTTGTWPSLYSLHLSPTLASCIFFESGAFHLLLVVCTKQRGQRKLQQYSVLVSDLVPASEVSTTHSILQLQSGELSQTFLDGPYAGIASRIFLPQHKKHYQCKCNRISRF